MRAPSGLARLITACDGRYYRCLQQLLLSLERTPNHGDYECSVFDLGLEPQQCLWLVRRFPWIRLLRPDFSQAPGQLSQLSYFAWKPTLIAQILEESPTPLLWLDSACVLLGPLQSVWHHLEEHGVWSPFGGGSRMDARTHPGMLKQLATTDEERAARFRSACACAFNPCFPGVLELVRQWRALAWDPEILTPPGSCNANHRYDQSLLTVLLSRSGLNPSSHELDVSGRFPVPFLRTRNKISNSIPLCLDPICRLWFWLYREVDVALLRLQAGGGESVSPSVPHPGSANLEPVAWPEPDFARTGHRQSRQTAYP